MIDHEQRAKAETKIAAKIALRVKNNIDATFRDLLKKPEGRDFLWWLLQTGKVGMQPFQGQSDLTAFACGELNVGQIIFARLLETEPAGYLRMLEDRANDDRERSATVNDTDD